MKDLTRREFLRSAGKMALAVGAFLAVGRAIKVEKSAPVAMSFRVTAKPKKE